MPDISMCRGEGCPKKDQCYRYTAKPTPGRQSYLAVPPFDHKTGSCEYQLPGYSQYVKPKEIPVVN